MLHPKQRPMFRARHAIRRTTICAVALATGTAIPAVGEELMPSSQAPAKLSATIYGHRSTGEIEGPACAGFSGIFDSDDPVAEPIETLQMLTPRGSVDATWAMGVEPRTQTHARILEADPNGPDRLAAASGTWSHDSAGIHLEFSQQRRAIETILGDPDDLLWAWAGIPTSGVAILNPLEEFSGEAEFQLPRPTIVRVQATIEATDIRTADWSYHESLQWTLTALTGSLLEQSETELLVDCDLSPEQSRVGALSLRPPNPVDREARGCSNLLLPKGTYRIHVRLASPNKSPQALLNACLEERGSWAATNVARLDVGIANPTDIDGDGQVEFGDVSLALLEYGPCDPGTLSDLDGSNEVDFGDIALILLSYGSRTPEVGRCKD